MKLFSKEYTIKQHIANTNSSKPTTVSTRKKQSCYQPKDKYTTTMVKFFEERKSNKILSDFLIYQIVDIFTYIIQHNELRLNFITYFVLKSFSTSRASSLVVTSNPIEVKHN